MHADLHVPGEVTRRTILLPRGALLHLLADASYCTAAEDSFAFIAVELQVLPQYQLCNQYTPCSQRQRADNVLWMYNMRQSSYGEASINSRGQEMKSKWILTQMPPATLEPVSDAVQLKKLKR